MNEIVELIDKNLEVVKKERLFQIFFIGAILDTKEEDVDYLSNYDKGIELVLSKQKIIWSIHFFGKEGPFHKRFVDKLPFGITFSFSRQDVRSIFGVPHRNGGGHTSVALGHVNRWDKYLLSTYSLRFEYTLDEKEIVMLTVASLELEGALNINLQ